MQASGEGAPSISQQLSIPEYDRAARAEKSVVRRRVARRMKCTIRLEKLADLRRRRSRCCQSRASSPAPQKERHRPRHPSYRARARVRASPRRLPLGQETDIAAAMAPAAPAACLADTGAGSRPAQSPRELAAEGVQVSQERANC